MKTLNKLTLISLLATSSLVASEIGIDSVGFNLGISNTPYTQKNHAGSITLGNTPDKKYSSYELYTRLCSIYTNETLKPYISYIYSTNDELKHQYILLGLNKEYKYKELILNATLLAGYGELKYKYNPLISSKDNNYKASSFLVGLQTGIELPLNDKLSLSLSVKYLYHNYETKLEPTTTASSNLENKYTTSVGAGVVYKF